MWSVSFEMRVVRLLYLSFLHNVPRIDNRLAILRWQLYDVGL